LVKDIWDSISEQPEQIKLTNSQKKNLIKDIWNILKNPSESKTWKEIKKVLKIGNDQ
jgi:putative addiction module component (TIGR02574 family)